MVAVKEDKGGQAGRGAGCGGSGEARPRCLQSRARWVALGRKAGSRVAGVGVAMARKEMVGPGVEGPLQGSRHPADNFDEAD